MIVEAEKPHNLAYASWRPGKGRGVIQLDSKVWRARKAGGVNFSSRAGKDETRCPSSSSEAGEKWR